MPISFNFGARVDDHGALQAADGGFALGAGHFRLDNPDHKAFLVDEASGKIHWDAASRSFVAEGLEMLAGESHYRFDGVVEPPPGGEGPWRLRFASRDFVYGPERPGDQPVVIDKAVAEAWFFADSGRFVVDRMTIHGPKVQGELSLEATPQGDSFAFKFELRAEQAHSLTACDCGRPSSTRRPALGASRISAPATSCRGRCVSIGTPTQRATHS